MIVRDNSMPFSCIYFLKKKEHAYNNFKQFLMNIRDHGEVEVVRSENEDNSRGKTHGDYWLIG